MSENNPISEEPRILPEDVELWTGDEFDKISLQMTGVLRHNLSVRRGFDGVSIRITDLIWCLKHRKREPVTLSENQIRGVVKRDTKYVRFSVGKRWIKATYGYSILIMPDLIGKATKPPKYLFYRKHENEIMGKNCIEPYTDNRLKHIGANCVYLLPIKFIEEDFGVENILEEFDEEDWDELFENYIMIDAEKMYKDRVKFIKSKGDLFMTRFVENKYIIKD